MGRKTALPIVDGKAQAVEFGGIGEHQATDPVGAQTGVGFLQAQDINVVGSDQCLEFGTRLVLAEVVADDFNLFTRF